jgi:hypothetical protein
MLFPENLGQILLKTNHQVKERFPENLTQILLKTLDFSS